MRFTDPRYRNGKGIRKPATAGYVKKPSGSAKIYRCAVCLRVQLCTKLGVQYLCTECKGGQG